MEIRRDISIYFYKFNLNSFKFTTHLIAVLGCFAIAGRVVATTIHAAAAATVAHTDAVAISAQSATTATGWIHAHAATGRRAITSAGTHAHASRQTLFHFDFIASRQPCILEIRHGEHICAGVVRIEASQFRLTSLDGCEMA